MVKHDWVCIHLHDLSYGWYQKHRSIERHSSVRYCKNTIWRFSLACCIGTGNETDNERKHWYTKPTILKIFESQLHNIIWLSRSSAFLTMKFSKQFLWNREPVLEWNMQILFICFRCTFLHGDIQCRKKMPEKAKCKDESFGWLSVVGRCVIDGWAEDMEGERNAQLLYKCCF